MTRMIPDTEVVSMLNDLVKDLVSFPFPRVCKHYAAMKVLEAMESHGLHLPPAEIIKAVVTADDETVLNWV